MGRTIYSVELDAFSLLQTIRVEVSVMRVDVSVFLEEVLQLVIVSN